MDSRRRGRRGGGLHVPAHQAPWRLLSSALLVKVKKKKNILQHFTNKESNQNRITNITPLLLLISLAVSNCSSQKGVVSSGLLHQHVAGLSYLPGVSTSTDMPTQVNLRRIKAQTMTADPNISLNLYPHSSNES